MVLLPIGIALAAFVARNRGKRLRLDTDGLSGEFGRVRRPPTESMPIAMTLGSPRDEAVGGLGGGLSYASDPFPTGSTRTFPLA